MESEFFIKEPMFGIVSEKENSYLKLSGKVFGLEGSSKITIPKINVNLIKCNYTNEQTLYGYRVIDNQELTLTLYGIPDQGTIFYMEYPENRKKMTLEQIERELGYKISIID